VDVAQEVRELTRRHPLAKCEECPLHDPKNAFVPTLHSDKPELVVVGEAPGYQEGTRGEPFVGPSGQLLDKVLEHNGYHRRDVTYTNVVLCRPPGNATPDKKAIGACKERLLNDVRASNVSDVVALGATAASALVDDGRTITNLRVGPPKSPTHGLDGSNVRRVVPTWHPAYCLRNADAFPALVNDIAKLKGDDRVWSPPDWRAFDDVPSALAVIAELQRRYDRLVVDIEVGIEKDASFGHPNDYDLLCVGIAYGRGKAVVLGTAPLQDKTVLDALRQLLRDKRIIAHNGKFDLAGLYPVLGSLTLWFDTMLASYCLDERPGGHKLEVLGVERLGTPSWKDVISTHIPRGGNYANVPRPILYKYNAYDVAVTWDLYELFAPLLEEEVTDWPYPDLPVKTLRDAHDHMVAASNQLMFLELNGIAIDRPYQQELRGIFQERIGTIEAAMDEIFNIGGTKLTVAEIVAGTALDAEGHQIKWQHINPRSPKQLKEYFASQGVTLDSTDKKTVDQLIERLVRMNRTDIPLFAFCERLLEHRRQAKLFSTYVEGIRKRMYKGRVNTTYMLHGSTSGRLASRNPNLQNIVRDKPVRKQFVPTKEENVFIQCDYKQAEGRVIAWMAQDEYLRSIFNDPSIDIFDNLSDQLYGPGNWAKEERVRTKAFFYGIGYGREPYSIGLEYGMSAREAERRYSEFMDLIPGVARWQQQVRDKVLSGEDLVTPFGRRRRFWLITKENKKEVSREALSFLPQSTASDVCLGALTVLRPMLRGHGFIRLTIHDALVAECHKDKAPEVSRMMQEVMVAKGRELTDYVPFPVDISIGKSWGEL
jgi:uracil-DNA glycosylase family 4